MHNGLSLMYFIQKIKLGNFDIFKGIIPSKVDTN